MKIISHWYWSILLFLFIFYAGISIIYQLGSDSVRITRATVDFDRNHDNTLYKIDEDIAFSVDRSNTVYIVKYKKAIAPFCILCGKHVLNGSIVNVVGYRKDDWFYSEYIGPFSEGFNTKTLETFDISDEGHSDSIDPSLIPEYSKRNLIFSENFKIDIAYIAKNFEPISTMNESCLIYNIAFLLVIGVWILFGAIFILVKFLKK